MLSHRTNLIPAAIVAFALISCTPSIYLIDRQTVLELEASGDWQELDKKLRAQELQSGPIPLEKTRDAQDKRPSLGMTHGDDPTLKQKRGR